MANAGPSKRASCIRMHAYACTCAEGQGREMHEGAERVAISKGRSGERNPSGGEIPYVGFPHTIAHKTNPVTAPPAHIRTHGRTYLFGIHFHFAFEVVALCVADDVPRGVELRREEPAARDVLALARALGFVRIQRKPTLRYAGAAERQAGRQTECRQARIQADRQERVI